MVCKKANGEGMCALNVATLPSLLASEINRGDSRGAEKKKSSPRCNKVHAVISVENSLEM